jgi:hypothetical protein
MNADSFFPAKERVLAMPSWEAPRLMLVSRSVRQRWQDSAAFYPALRWRARALKSLLRVCVAVAPWLFARKSSRSVPGGPMRVPAFLDHHFPSFKHSATAYALFPEYFRAKGILPCEGENLTSDCCEELSGLVMKWFPQADRRVVIWGAASDPKQKSLVQLTDASGQRLGFIKCGWKPLARERVRTESDLLQKLPEGGGPKWLGFAEIEGMTCLALGVLAGRMGPARLPAVPEACAQRLSGMVAYLTTLKADGRAYEIDAHPAILGLKSKLPVDAVARNTRWEATLTPLRGSPWPVVLQHGDFAPWNVVDKGRESGGSQYAALDWEEGVREGFPWFDFIYYILQTAYLMHHWPASRAAGYTREVLCHAREEGARRGLQATEKRRIAAALISLAALDAWATGEAGGLSGNELQRFRWDVALESHRMI